MSRHEICCFHPHMKPLPPSNHSNFVTQKHAAVTCSVSSSLARIADAEWARCCENVRKSSPQIGSLGEWRSLCDGGWTGKIPDDLPDTDIPIATGPSLAALSAVEEEPNSDTDLGANRASLANTSDCTPSNLLPVLHSPTTDSDLSRHDPVAVKGDLPTLDYFPVPPVHFPLPHLKMVLTGSLDGPAGNPPLYGRRITSPVLPIQESPDLTATTPTELAAVTATQTPSPTRNIRAETFTYLPAPSRSDPYKTLLPTDPLTTGLTTDNVEFEIRKPHPLPPSGLLDSSSLPKGSPRSSGVVLAMRNRFAQNVSYNRCAYVIQKVELHSLCLQRHQETLRPRSLVCRSMCQPSPVVINPTVNALHCARTGPKRGQPLNLPTMMQPAPIHWWVFYETTVLYLLISNQGTNADFERTRKQPLLKEQDFEQGSKELGLVPRRLIRSTSAQAENTSARDRGGRHNQPTNIWETVGPRQNVSPRHMPPVAAESLQRGLTRSPSPVRSHTPPHIGSPGSPQEIPRTAKSRGWIRRLSMPVLSSLDGSKKTDSPAQNGSSQAWRSDLALPETNPRHRKTSLDTLGSKPNQRR